MINHKKYQAVMLPEFSDRKINGSMMTFYNLPALKYLLSMLDWGVPIELAINRVFPEVKAGNVQQALFRQFSAGNIPTLRRNLKKALSNKRGSK